MAGALLAREIQTRLTLSDHRTFCNRASFCIQWVLGRPRGQDISMKKVCESNKTDSHTQIEALSLCHLAIKIAYLKCIGPCGCPGWGALSPLLTHFIGKPPISSP